jgi:hypothetical protein
MIDILIFFIAFFLSLISVISYGKIFEKLCFNKILPDSDKLIYTGFFGLMFLTLISLITSLFLPHNFYHNIILHGVGFFYFFTNVLKKDKEYLKYIFFISLLVISALIISKTNDDFPYYHLPYTKYLTEYKVIFGMGHLNHGYNLLSSLFYLNSVFYLPLINLYSFHFSIIFILVFFNYFLIKEILFNKNITTLKYMYIFSFAYFNLSFTRLSEFGTDKAGQLLIVLLIIKLFDLVCSEFKSKKLENILLLIPLLGFCITLKTYFLPYILLGLSILMIDGKIYKNFKFIIFSKSFLLFLMIIILMFLHHFISTGCIVSPLPFTCFGDNVVWGKDIEVMKGLARWLEQWAKSGAGPNFRAENLLLYVQNFNWVGNWTKMYFVGKFSDQLGILFASYIIITLLFKKFSFSKSKLAMNYKKIIYFYLILIIIFMVWFTNHPTLRYGGYSIFFLIVTIPISILVTKLTEKKLFSRNFNFFIIFIVVLFNFKNIDRITKEFNRTDMYKFSNFPYYSIKKMDYIETKYAEGLTIYSANGHCWFTKSPCGGIPEGGYKIHKKKSYYFIQDEK